MRIICMAMLAFVVCGCATTFTHAELRPDKTLVVDVTQYKLWDDQQWHGHAGPDGSIDVDVSGRDTTGGGMTLQPVLMKALDTTSKALDKVPTAAPLRAQAR